MSADELWDLTDASGRPVGRTHRRGDPMPLAAFHIVASVCVVRRDGAVLLSQRAAAKDYPLAWEFAAGSAIAGETSAEAASRELCEETGVVVGSEDLIFVGRLEESSALFDLYVAHVDEDPPVRIDPEEVAAAEWVTFDEVERRLHAGLLATPWTARLVSFTSALRAQLPRI